MKSHRRAGQPVQQVHTNPQRKRGPRDCSPSLARRAGLIAGCWVAALLLPAGSVLYGQSTPFAENDRTIGGSFGLGRDVGGGFQGTTGARDSAAGTNRVDRTGRFGSRSGTRNSSDDSAGSPQRIDRSKTSAGSNPLAPRGINVRAGDPALGQGTPGAADRLAVITDNAVFSPLFDRSDGNRLNQTKASSERRPQYIARMASVSLPPPTGVDDLTTRTDTVTVIQQSLAGLYVESIEVELDGGTAVLRGTVASESDRRVAERTAKLEPGVRQVRNELVVAAPAGDR